MCSICLSRSGQAPVAHSSGELHKQIPSFTMSISSLAHPGGWQTTSQERSRHKPHHHAAGHNARTIRRRGQSGCREWWSQTGSNRRPEACKATALPTELWPRFKPTFQTNVSNPPRTTQAQTGRLRFWWAWEDLNFRPHAYQARALTN